MLIINLFPCRQY